MGKTAGAALLRRGREEGGCIWAEEEEEEEEEEWGSGGAQIYTADVGSSDCCTQTALQHLVFCSVQPPGADDF